ncbi:hypothetical protein [Tabrizicola fusiformis]|uniref:hypothetical protein n=1 Tax=Tabrizicola sp. SY72 TaxID=2741673 RepID=UPI001573CEC3|nr:hypothetical protein [Tabrizicola sp. SY72]NTT87277.1 hypothetical protein [Tabrizicola sp. SY72]
MISRDEAFGQIALDGFSFEGIPLGAALLGPPDAAEKTAFAGQGPLVSWLVQVCRPGMILGLGLRSAAEYFTLCRTCDALNLSARAWGFGGWEDEGGGLSVPEALRARNARDHAEMSRLARVPDPALALKRFAPDMFDLILLDSAAADEAPAALADTLAQATSPRGVLLLQGPEGALHAALAARFPMLRFAAHGGLAVVLTGAKPPPVLAELASAAAAPKLRGLEALLARLGEGAEQAARLHRLEGDLAQARVAAAPVEPASPARDPATAEVDRLRTALDDGHLLRLRETQILTVELERLTEELHLSRAEAANLHSRVDQVAAADEARAAAQAAEAELAALRIRHFDELHDLRDEVDWTARALDTARQAEAEATARADQAIAEQTRLTARLAAEAKAAEAARAQLDKLKAETARRDAQRLVQVKLRGWQVEWLLAQGGRLGRRNGPSGGALAQEIAAVAGHPLFNADWYRATYPDLRDSPLPPAEHFLRHGLFEGRNPGPDFVTLAWFVANPEALTARRNPLLIADLPPQRS